MSSPIDLSMKDPRTDREIIRDFMADHWLEYPDGADQLLLEDVKADAAEMREDARRKGE